ncbi:glucuronate isomerase [Paenibacillus oleatilyticus]|uniref:glucuronate isomerase n=1 Tax=Paenibacillus oleatilyticus TaxID=2594886 RepID=UPI001C1F48DA|nr:glucuronate isomerase [Paenibacillus oleatilyticus]MBU7314450.1 glucuronate isomerase [Paenibacillus oleatilyticus]
MTARETWIAEVEGIETLDTHTHLIGDKLCAQSFWDIAHYFWLNREMQAGGYPADAAELPEKERIEAFMKAYRATRNTLMNWTVTHIFKQLYGIELRDERSVYEADEAVRASSQKAGWAQQVADKLNVRAFVVNHPDHAKFVGMKRDAILLPRIDGKLPQWTRNIAASAQPEEAYEEARQTIDTLFASYREQGCPGVMTTLPAFEASANRSYSLKAGATEDQILMMLLHAVCEAAERHGLMVQIFVGVERSWCGTATPVNDPLKIVKLSGLFERYAVPFELVTASELNNLDIVQAAWNFPNVHTGGQWWFNFRASTYRDAMQYRLEALPALKSSLIVSDARCIEWSYGKIALVKRLMAEFLFEQTERGWIDRETAQQVARGWLYESAAQRYGFREQ